LYFFKLIRSVSSIISVKDQGHYFLNSGRCNIWWCRYQAVPDV